MLMEPDRDQFMDAMNKEVTSLFNEDIWKMVPKREMLEHYTKQKNEGKEIKGEKSIMIWSFNHKRNHDGTLHMHKVRLC